MNMSISEHMIDILLLDPFFEIAGREIGRVVRFLGRCLVGSIIDVLIDVRILTTGMLYGVGSRSASAGHFGTWSTECCCRWSPRLRRLRRLAWSDNLLNDPRRERLDRMCEIIGMAPHDIGFIVGSSRRRIQREIASHSFFQFLLSYFKVDIRRGLGESLWSTPL